MVPSSLRLQFLSFFMAVAATTPLAAQEHYPLKWDDKPAIHPIPDSFQKLSAVFILEERQSEIGTAGGTDYIIFRTIHNIIRLVDDKGVEAFNTFKIPVSANR